MTQKATREMIEAGAAVIEQGHGVVDSFFLANEVYSVMASLAPPPTPAKTARERLANIVANDREQDLTKSMG